ncbi:kinase-like protein [Stereum hirsutum FP-91666 SS1]|uniref:kinase-like protein n=1 Tax=Stereum hirsutum (strain FP-91666) TaxID=721885 RepID=UPI0004410307|nr:kinase-like protein [Stereum hirsutum FP-91666 SS1]EIM91142.1 kinase-like protein [Stereum hirsutum FP-91666 SS1]
MGCCFSEPVDFDAAVNLYHFNLHRAIGKGAFGKVRVVEHKRTKALYALKYIDKSKCIDKKSVANVIQERRLLEEVDHPFVVNLRYAFQDDYNCYFALDLMLGGDTRFHLNQLGSFPEETVRFWMAELACAISYLHDHKIVHRDVKPDNILLDTSGHAHLTDFNIAIHYSDRRLHTSVAGSMAYMAPEIIHPNRRGYSWQVDWWSLGVCAYELLWHKRPFDGKSAEKTRASILNDPIRLPPARTGAGVQQLSQEGCDAISRLLDRNSRTRLGCRSLATSLDDFKNHPWFSRINWERLESKQLVSPFVPNMGVPNFDVQHELDEFMAVEKPLKHKKPAANRPDPERMRPELRQLEEQFTMYDFTTTTRRSYYPMNEPIVATKDGEDDGTILVQSRTGTMEQESRVMVRSRPPSPQFVNAIGHPISFANGYPNGPVQHPSRAHSHSRTPSQTSSHPSSQSQSRPGSRHRTAEQPNRMGPTTSVQRYST